MIAKTRPMTVEEYFAYDEASDIRHEYIDGDIFPITGGTRKHSLIIAYTIGALIDLLRNSDCDVYSNNMRVKIDESNTSILMSRLCVNSPYGDEKEITLLNPTVVVEVTSPSSFTHDHQTKLEHYGAVPSIPGYLILDQERVFADWHTRAAEGWHLRQYSDSAASIPLEPLDIELPLSRVYSRVRIAG